MKRISPAARMRLARVARRRAERNSRQRNRIPKSRERIVRALSERRAFYARHGIPAQGNADQLPILLPETLSLRDNHENVMEAVDAMRQAVLVDHRRVYLHFDRVKNLEPAAALLLAAECYRCRHLISSRRGDSVVGNYPMDRGIYRLLKSMGFFKLLRVRDDLEKTLNGAPDPNSPVFLGFHTQRDVPGALASSFCDLVTKGAFSMDAKTRGQMVAALKEAMGNAVEHAYSAPTEYASMQRRWWIAGYLDPGRQEMMFMLLDQGIGIPKKLPPETFERICSLISRLSLKPSDGNMILAATELYRTSTGQSTRGRGFRDMKRFVDSCDDGELRVLSNAGSYAYVNGQETVHDHARSIGGTIIEWRVRHASTPSVRVA